MKRSYRWTWGLSVACLALLLVVAPGCKHGGEMEPDMGGTPTTSTSTRAQDTGTSQGLPDIDQEKLIIERIKELETIYFDFDSYALRDDARDSLKRNSEKIKQLPADVIIQIEGHCDERGTQEYNFALGERRALATREYLMTLGISGDRMITISYGEENPADPGQGEAAWAKNRRCQYNKAQ